MLSTINGSGKDIAVWAIRPFNGVFDDHGWEQRLFSHVLHCSSHYCYIGFLSFSAVEANHDNVSLMKLSHVQQKRLSSLSFLQILGQKLEPFSKATARGLCQSFNIFMLKLVIHRVLFLLTPNIGCHNLIDLLHNPMVDRVKSLNRGIGAIMAHKEVNWLCIQMHV